MCASVRHGTCSTFLNQDGAEADRPLKKGVATLCLDTAGVMGPSDDKYVVNTRMREYYH